MTGTPQTTLDSAREDVLRRYNVHDLGPRRQLQALADLAAMVCDAPMAAISMIGETDQHRVATVGIDRGVCTRDGTLCSTSLLESEPVLVPDARLDPRFADSAFVTGERGAIRFYASHQLRTPGGVTFGTICVFDREPRELSAMQFSALGTLAEQVVDVLELELLTVKLARANMRLATSNERLGDFAGQLSHDLKNPLGAMTMALRMAEGALERLPSEQRTPLTGLLENAGRCTGRMTTMIDNLLDYARSGADPIKVPVDLRLVVETVLEDLHTQVAGYTITMTGLPVVEADELQMRVLLQNLIGNALKFTAQVENPVVCVRGRRTPEGWRLEVLDNGPGIPEADRERVFELFARGDKTSPGSGIGLSTCRKLVDAHEGRIGVEEGRTGGTLVWVELPAAPASAPGVAAQAVQASA